MAVKKKTVAKKAVAKKAVRKSVLVVWGGWNGHEPKECTDVLVPWLKSKGFRVVVSDSMDIYTNKRRMRAFDLVVPTWTMGEITGEQWKGLNEAVLNGTNVAGWHGGMCDAFRNNTGYQFMTGGQWVDHPGGIIRYKVNVTNQKDPITKGLTDFAMKSEQYYMHTDPGNEVLATTTFSGRHGDSPWIKGTVMPVVWKRKYGSSRIFYSSLGHVASEFKVPEVFEILKRGILWAMGEKVVSEYTGK